MPLNNFTGDIETHTQSRIRFSFITGDLEEAFKNLLLILLCNTNAKILNAHNSFILLFYDMDQYSICVGRIFNGIIQQVNQDLPNTVPITKHSGLALSLKHQVMCLC